MPGVYVHFPWCLAKCPYCDFVSYAASRDAIDHEGYADAVVAELAMRVATFEGRRFDSVFFGGGTPSLWEPRALGRVLGAVRDRLACGSGLEVTVECNPTSLDAERARALADVGVTRLSIGSQSLRADQLKFLGRLHDPDGAARALDAAQSVAGLRVSTDLIFGLPQQSPEDARDQAATLAGRGLAHLSCYALTIEPGTRFGELARVGRLPLADDGHVADAFLAIHEALEDQGLLHYEISNYAQPGEEARHNLGYWRGEEYLGLGCAAVGLVRDDDLTQRTAHGHRWRNDPDPKKYIQKTMTGLDPASSHEELDGQALLRERIMLGLRMAEGVDLDAAGAALFVDPWTRERQRTTLWLEQHGRIAREAGRLRVSPHAWLLADDTAARLF
jgi:oxygen-independent coproporphyrinogen-3 oxidase